MTDTLDETWSAEDLLDWCEEEDYGATYRDRLRQVIEVARTRGDEDLEFQANLRVVADATMTDKRELGLPAFAWMLAKHREDPGRFGGDRDQSSCDFFWQFKWMPYTLYASTAFSDAQLQQILEDFDQTYTAAGLPTSAVVTARFESALAAGDLDAAREWDVQLASMGRDDYSSCEACVASNSIDLAVLRGEHERAAETALTMWAGGLSCGEEPETALGAALLSMLRAGRLDDAKRAFEFAYEQASSDEDEFGVIADCVLFAAVTGNEQRALSMIERHLPQFGHSVLQDLENLEALRAFAVALSRLAKDGHGDVVVRGSDDPALGAVIEVTGQRRTVAELADAFWNGAQVLADAFDARHGNDFRARWLDEGTALVDESWHVDLGGVGFAPALLREPEPTTPEGLLARGLDADVRGEDGRPWLFAAIDSGELGLEELNAATFRAAQHALRAGDEDQVLGFEGTRVEALVPHWDAATVAFVEARGPLPVAEPTVAAAALGAAGDIDATERALTELVIAWGLLEGEVTQEHLEEARERLTAAVESGALPAAIDTDARFTLSRVFHAAGAIDDALAIIAPLAEPEPGRGASDAVQGMVAMVSARLHSATGDTGRELAALDTAATLFARAGARVRAMDAALTAGASLVDAREFDDAITRLRYAASLRDADEPLDPRVEWHLALALLGADDDTEEAVVLLEATLARERAEGADAAALAATLYHLGRAYDVEADERCAATFEEAARLAREAGHAPLACLSSLGAAWEHLIEDDNDEALEHARAALDAATTADEPVLKGRSLRTVGQALFELRDESWRASMQEAIVELERAGAEEERESTAELFASMDEAAAKRAARGEDEDDDDEDWDPIDPDDLPAAVSSALSWGEWDQALSILIMASAQDDTGDETATIGDQMVGHLQAPVELRKQVAHFVVAKLIEVDRVDEAAQWEQRADSLS